MMGLTGRRAKTKTLSNLMSPHARNKFVKLSCVKAALLMPRKIFSLRQGKEEKIDEICASGVLRARIYARGEKSSRRSVNR